MGTAAAMATVDRVADLETMGQKHGLSLNLHSRNNMVLLTINRELYCYKNHFDTVIDTMVVSAAFYNASLSLLRPHIITWDTLPKRPAIYFTIKLICMLSKMFSFA